MFLSGLLIFKNYTGQQKKDVLGLLADSEPACCAESEYHFCFAWLAPV